MSATERAGTMRRQRRAPLGWLAVFALLINALLPAALSGVPRAGESAGSAGFCGHAPESPPPGLPLGSEHHCPLCCTVPASASPPHGVRITAPRLTGEANLAAVPEAPVPTLFPYGSPRPRGPPARV